MYVMLTHVEKAFRNFMTDLKLRPNFHQIEKRVDGHVFTTSLAYHLLHSIEYTLRENNCSSSWATIKRIVVFYHYSTDDQWNGDSSSQAWEIRNGSQ